MNMIYCRTGQLLIGYFLLFFILFVSAAPAQDIKPVKPQPKDKCPVCGMFVAKYPQWIAEIIYKDGTYLFFDGPKDLFRFYFAPEKFQSSRRRHDIRAMYVTEYYYVSLIDAVSAFYVTGSDVYGPMGHELIPFANEADARKFLEDHKGQNIHTFDEVTPALIDSL